MLSTIQQDQNMWLETKLSVTSSIANKLRVCDFRVSDARVADFEEK